jgi:hypothetical protein
MTWNITDLTKSRPSIYAKHVMYPPESYIRRSCRMKQGGPATLCVMYHYRKVPYFVVLPEGICYSLNLIFSL